MTKPINEKPEVQYFSGAAKSINFLDRNASASIEAKRVQSFKSFVVTIDLHMHSNASDGILPPAEVVRLCAGNGVKLCDNFIQPSNAGKIVYEILLYSFIRVRHKQSPKFLRKHIRVGSLSGLCPKYFVLLRFGYAAVLN